MYDKKKKFRRSPVTIICYVLAALMLIYTCYQGGTTVHQINEYYGQYGMKATPVEYITYVGQAIMATLINAIVLFMLAKIHDDVRKKNPANFRSDEDIAEAAEEKKAAKDTKQFEKGEKAAAKAAAEKGDVSVSVKTESEEPVVVDFAVADVDVEPEAPNTPAAKKPAAKKASGSTARKPAAKKTTAKKASDEKAAPKKTTAKKAAPKKKTAAEKSDGEKAEKNEKTEE